MASASPLAAPARDRGTPGNTISSLMNNTDWLEDFAQKHGRALRVLHIGNIANNAYRNAAVQRRRGIEADVVCYDYYHIMGCPEWEEAEIKGIYDAFYPDWWSLDVGGWSRPDWFVQGQLASCLDYLKARQLKDAAGCRAARIVLLREYEQLLVQQLADQGQTRRPRDLLSDQCRPTTLRLAPELADGINSGAAFAGASRAARTRSAVRTAFDRYSSSAWHRSLTEFTKSGLLNEALGKRAAGLSLTPSDRAALRLYAAWTSRQRQRPSLGPLPTSAWQHNPGRHGKSHLVARYVAGTTLWGVLQPAAAILRSSQSETDARMVDAPGISAELSDRYRADYRDVPNETIEDDLAAHGALVAQWAGILDHYDVVQGYAFDASIPLFLGHPAFAAYEHGTIRLIPFEETRRGRLCRFVYKHAPKVFITNSDVLPSADRIPIAPEARVPIPHAFDDAPLNAFYIAHPKLKRADGPVHFFSPTRHHWQSGDTSWLKGNDVFLRAAADVVRGGQRLRITLVEWGQEVEQSRALIDDLGLTPCVTWVATLNRSQLWAAYLEADVVVDQFVVPALGGVGYEALTLGARLMTRLDASTVAIFFGEAPPILNAASVEEATACIRDVLADPDDAAELGPRGRKWALAYHSTQHLFDLQLDGYRGMLDASPKSGRP